MSQINIENIANYLRSGASELLRRRKINAAARLITKLDAMLPDVFLEMKDVQRRTSTEKWPVDLKLKDSPDDGSVILTMTFSFRDETVSAEKLNGVITLKVSAPGIALYTVDGSSRKSVHISHSENPEKAASQIAELAEGEIIFAPGRPIFNCPHDFPQSKAS